MGLPRTSPDVKIPPEQLGKIVESAIPAWAFRSSPVSWTWTRPAGVWHLNLNLNDDHGGPSLKARLDASPILLQVCVRTSLREVNAALRFLVLVDAIDRHPDDPYAEAESAS